MLGYESPKCTFAHQLFGLNLVLWYIWYEIKQGLQFRNSAARYISKLWSLSYCFLMTLFWSNRIDRFVVVITSSLVLSFCSFDSCFLMFGYNVETMGHRFTGGKNDGTSTMKPIMEFPCWQVTVMRVLYLLWKGICQPYSAHPSSPGLPPRPCLLFQVQHVTLLHTLVSIYEVWFFILINIYFSKSIYCEFVSIRTPSFDTYCWFFWQKAFPIILWKHLPAVRRLTKKTQGDTEKEIWRKLLTLCEWQKVWYNCHFVCSFC